MTAVWKNLVGAAVLVGATTIITTNVVSQDQGDMPDMEQMMVMFKEMAAPAEQHRKMAESAGSWTQETTHWMPGSPASTSVGTAEMKSILGGRYMVEKVHSEMEFMGEKHEFEGMGVFGYDKATQKHFFVWFDNMGTGYMLGEGKEDGKGLITYYSKLLDPMTGQMAEYKSVSNPVADDRHTLEMYVKMPDGSWFRNMEIVSTRK